jgi:transcriptional regulator with XRE-family HTH domain
MAASNKQAGHRMRELRESLGLTMRDVQDVSKKIAKPLRNRDYAVSPSRLSDIEDKGKTPNLYRLHALSLVYDCRVEKLLKFYGIDGRGGTK